MSTSPSPHEVQRKSISLSRFATIFAVTFAIAFGLCTASATAIVGVNQKIGAGLIWISVAVEGVCLIGLLAIGIIAIFRSVQGR
jgi:hypothetical protein